MNRVFVFGRDHRLDEKFKIFRTHYCFTLLVDFLEEVVLFYLSIIMVESLFAFESMPFSLHHNLLYSKNINSNHVYEAYYHHPKRRSDKAFVIIFFSIQ